MKLYGSLASPYVARVVLFSRLKGFDLEPQLPEGGIKSAAYLAMNPMGKIQRRCLDRGFRSAIRRGRGRLPEDDGGQVIPSARQSTRQGK